jgi:ribonucleotide reductase alpha subunit
MTPAAGATSAPRQTDHDETVPASLPALAPAPKPRPERRTRNIMDVGDQDRFYLKPAFVEDFRTKKVNWGPVGYFTYKRTYARPLDDGTLEEWWQTVRRVVEGTYTVQKWHCNRLHLPWSERKAQRSAQEMYRLIFEMKFLPPGRGLWMMGTSVVEKLGGAPLMNCLAHETEVLTEGGVRNIGDLAGTIQRLMTRGGAWVDAPIRAFGEQPLRRITISRRGTTKDIFATPSHRWFVRTADETDFREAITDYLEAGQTLEGATAWNNADGGWVVQGVEETNRFETVYCATVDGEGAFVLADSILTGNCAFHSTDHPEFSRPFTFTMGMSMLGVGTGYDTLGAGNFTIRKPRQGADVHVVEDSRDGWVDLARRVLDAYVGKGDLPISVDYSKVRPAGTPIKGFGGIAAGPDPLALCIKRIHAVLEPLIRHKITSTAIADLMDIIGVCVVSGNVRRSALIALGKPDDTAFIELKDPELHPEELRAYRWASNNTVFGEVGMDYHIPAANTAKNGEPGYFWLDNARNFGRMGDGRQQGIDGRVGGLNPCVTGDTWVQTIDGPRQVTDLVGKQTEVIVDGVAHPTGSEGFFSTGSREVFRLDTEEGWSLRLTADHQLLTPHGWVAAKDLRPGSHIELNDHRGLSWPSRLSGKRAPSEDKGEGSHKGGRALGWLLGPDLDSPVDQIESEIADVTPGYVVLAQGEERIGPAIERASSDFQCSLIKGLFDTAGVIEQTPSGEIRIALFGGRNRTLLEAVQRMLGRLGVLSNIELVEADTDANQAWHLVMQGERAHDYGARIGLSGHMRDALKGMGLFTPSARAAAEATFKSLTLDGTEEVYDVTVPGIHAFDANGFVAHNCGEQTLESGELCCLVETFPASHATYEEYEHTLKYAYLYGKTVTLVPTHDRQTNRIQMRNRRIGLSQSGIAQSFTRHGRRTHFIWSDKGYRYVRGLDTTYSDWLAVPKSIKVTTVKPAGTTSLLPQATPGMHFEHAEYYYRTVRVSKMSALVGRLRAANYRIEDDVWDPSSLVVYFPVHAKFYDRSKNDVPMFEQLEIAAQLQAVWSDNSVSATISFKPEEAHLISGALELYESRLKSISFLPLSEHGYAQAPYITIAKEEYEEAAGKLRRLNLAGIGHEVDDAYCDGDKCTVPGAPDTDVPFEAEGVFPSIEIIGS